MRSKPTQTTHEDFGRTHTVQTASNRSFGVMIAAGLFIYSAYPLVHRHPVRLWPLAPALLLLAIALTYPRLLAPLNRAWLRLGYVLQLVVGSLVIMLLFFVVMTPIAILKRRFGDDAMSLTWDKATDSYWIRRTGAPQPMKSQF